MDDFFKVGRLIELLLYGAATAYLGHQFGKPPEQRHWRRIKRKLSKKPSADFIDSLPPED